MDQPKNAEKPAVILFLSGKPGEPGWFSQAAVSSSQGWCVDRIQPAGLVRSFSIVSCFLHGERRGFVVILLHKRQTE